MSRSGATRASQAAQARLAARRRQEQRRRAVWISAVVAAVLVIAVLAGAGIWYAIHTAGSDDPDRTPANVTADGHGVPVGDGPVTVEIYLDFMCPACAQFHQVTHTTLDRYLADGTVTIVYRPIAILDRYSTTQYSTRSAAASGCAADIGMMSEFVAALLSSQPQQGTAGLSNGEIVQVATNAGVDGSGFDQCVRNDTYRGWATANTDAAFRQGVSATPTVIVDGERLEELSVAALTAAIDAAAG